MTNTKMSTTRKLEIVDETIEILKSGGTKFEGLDGEEVLVKRYTCHALASAEEDRDGWCAVGDFEESLIVKDFIKFSAEMFGMVLDDSGYHIDWIKTLGHKPPYWWNSGRPYLEERLSHLELFKQHITKELQ